MGGFYRIKVEPAISNYRSDSEISSELRSLALKIKTKLPIEIVILITEFYNFHYFYSFELVLSDNRQLREMKDEYFFVEDERSYFFITCYKLLMKEKFLHSTSTSDVNHFSKRSFVFQFFKIFYFSSLQKILTEIFCKYEEKILSPRSKNFVLLSRIQLRFERKDGSSYTKLGFVAPLSKIEIKTFIASIAVEKILRWMEANFLIFSPHCEFSYHSLFSEFLRFLEWKGNNEINPFFFGDPNLPPVVIKLLKDNFSSDLSMEEINRHSLNTFKFLKVRPLEFNFNNLQKIFLRYHSCLSENQSLINLTFLADFFSSVDFNLVNGFPFFEKMLQFYRQEEQLKKYSFEKILLESDGLRNNFLHVGLKSLYSSLARKDFEHKLSLITNFNFAIREISDIISPSAFLKIKHQFNSDSFNPFLLFLSLKKNPLLLRLFENDSQESQLLLETEKILKTENLVC